jgi:hypothetical protein
MTTAAPSDDSVDGAAGEKLPDTPTRRWAKTDATQRRILDAAADVFAARGFTAATMADIVDHSGASIGSIYHVAVDVGGQALEDRQEQLAHRAPFSNTVLEDRLPGSRRVCCGVRSIAGPPARCATSGHNMFRGPCAAMMACMWHFVSRWRCGRTDSGGRLPALGGRSGDVHSGLPIVARRENLWCTVRSACRVASKNSRAGDRVVAAEGNQRP